MEKIKYDSLYKFIVSIGIAIILVPFIFVIFIMENSNIILISENDINQLTNTAQEIIFMQQNYKHIILSNPIAYVIVTSIIIICGILIILYGIIQWRNKVQKYEDKSRELSNRLLEKQIQDLTPEEKEEKVREEIEQSKIKTEEKGIQKQSNKKQIQKYIQIQALVYEYIRKVFKDYKIFEEVKLEKQVYDCIALSKPGGYYDYIFEIKYFTSINSIKGKIEGLESQILQKELMYWENTKRNIKTVLIIMLENITEKELLENKKILDNIKERNNVLTKIIISDVNRIESDLINIPQI